MKKRKRDPGRLHLNDPEKFTSVYITEHRNRKRMTHRQKQLIVIGIIVLLVIIAGIVMLRAFTQEPVIAFKQSKYTMNIGDSQKLSVKLDPANGKAPKLSFTSDHPAVVSVNSDGRAKAKRGGTAVITCTSRDGQKIKVKITVKSPKQEKVIYITYDDGPSAEVTPDVLRVLKKYHATATFFVVGQQVKEYPELLEAEAAEGHTIAVHTYTHDYNKIYRSSDAYIKDFTRTAKLIKKLTGKTPLYWRFPGGGNNDFMSSETRSAILKELHKQGYMEMDWDAYTEDAVGVDYSVKSMSDNGIRSLKNSRVPVILIYDLSEKSHAAEVTENILKYFSKRGYSFEGLDDYYGAEITFGSGESGK